MKDKKDKIYYFQEKSNDILDLQDELTIEEIGIYFILKAGYFKYAGELKKKMQIKDMQQHLKRSQSFGNLQRLLKYHCKTLLSEMTVHVEVRLVQC